MLYSNQQFIKFYWSLIESTFAVFSFFPERESSMMLTSTLLKAVCVRTRHQMQDSNCLPTMFRSVYLIIINAILSVSPQLKISILMK